MNERRETSLLVLALVLVLGLVAPLLDSTIVNVAIPTLRHDLGASVATIQWVSTAYLLAMALAIPVTGWASQRYGARRVWLVALALFLAAWLAWDDRRNALSPRLVAPLAVGGAVLCFVLLNIEIADYHASGPTITFNFNANLAQDLSYTIGWALFALALLAAGIVMRNRACRIASIALLALTVLKCFLHDLGRLGGLYRVGSFVGLALSLALVAIVLQRFVLTPAEQQPSGA